MRFIGNGEIFLVAIGHTILLDLICSLSDPNLTVLLDLHVMQTLYDRADNQGIRQLFHASVSQ